MANLNRNKALDIAKAICISLMVIGHSGCPDYLNHFIYMFHMPCFFFISGWLLKDKYLTDWRKGLYNKIKGSYFPFVKWSLIFLLLHNVFAWLHLYDTSYSLHEFAIKALRIVTMTGSEQLLGGYWFLISLCWASVLSLLLLYFVNKCKLLNNSVIGGGILLAIAFASLENSLPMHLPQQLGGQTFLAIAFYLSGYLFHKCSCSFRFRKGWSFFLLPAVCSLFVNWGMSDCHGFYAFAYYVVALAGTLGVLSFAEWLAQYKYCSVLCYVGNKTLYILTFHFLSFKLISLCYIKLNNLPIELLAQFPTLQYTNSYLWIFYSIVGIIGSLLIWNIFHKQPLYKLMNH